MQGKSKIILSGIISTLLLILIYFLIVSLISGFNFALSQFKDYWYFFISLAAGFGVQVGLFIYLKQIIHENASSGVLATTGTTSTLSMISCCAHYLANIVPVLGIAGALSVITEYQIQLFWIGLGFNFLGIAFILSKIIKFNRTHA